MYPSFVILIKRTSFINKCIGHSKYCILLECNGYKRFDDTNVLEELSRTDNSDVKHISITLKSNKSDLVDLNIVDSLYSYLKLCYKLDSLRFDNESNNFETANLIVESLIGAWWHLPYVKNFNIWMCYSNPRISKYMIDSILGKLNNYYIL